MNKKVLIFYISKLSGHFHAANAIEKCLLEISRDVQIRKINAPEYTNPILGRILNKAYLEVIKKKPEVWGNIYDNPEVMKKTEKARNTLQRFNRPKMKKLLEGFSPDVIFCTQAFPCGMVAEYKKISGSPVKLVGVLTDFAPHSYWLYDEVDIYITPSEETAKVLVSKGVREDKIRVYGIPVDPKFSKKTEKEEIKKSLGLSPDLPVVLIMGGNQGLGCMDDVVRSLTHSPRRSPVLQRGENSRGSPRGARDTAGSIGNPSASLRASKPRSLDRDIGKLTEDHEPRYQLLVVTGSNKKLYSRLKKIQKQTVGSALTVFPFVENINELMDAADVIITKAGGMTVAESLVKALPMVIMNPIPGHERMNTDHLVSKGAAIEVEDPADLRGRLDGIFAEKGKLARMKDSAEAIAKPSSALDIARLAFS